MIKKGLNLKKNQIIRTVENRPCVNHKFPPCFYKQLNELRSIVV